MTKRLKRIAVFDVDNTLIKGHSQYLFAWYLFRHSLIYQDLFFKILGWFLLYRLHLTGNATGIRFLAYRAFEGYRPVILRRLFNRFFREELKMRLIPETVRLLKRHMRQGYEVVLVSASLRDIIEPLRIFLGVKVLIATRLKRRRGVYTGEAQGMPVYGRNKLRALKGFIRRQGFTLEGSFAYADHVSDLPLLKLVENPVCVRPGRELTLLARHMGWRVMR